MANGTVVTQTQHIFVEIAPSKAPPAQVPNYLGIFYCWGNLLAMGNNKLIPVISLFPIPNYVPWGNHPL